MLINCLILVLGLALIVKGADFLVDGSSAVARRFGISEFVIGLTIVGFGTSAPEMVVSFIGAIKGNADIAIGNVVGSNIMNTLLILGLTAVLMPMTITKRNLTHDIAINIGISVLVACLGMTHAIFGFGNDVLSRLEGILFLAIFALYMWRSFKSSAQEDVEEAEDKGLGLGKSIIMIVFGLAALIGGGELLVDSATDIARALGISDKFIAITVIALGTSLPELATCIVAAVKKMDQLALGNIVGSNLFNVLLILGGSAVIHPLSFANISLVDIGFLVLSAILVFTSAITFKKYTLDRFDGAVMLLCLAGYLGWLISSL